MALPFKLKASIACSCPAESSCLQLSGEKLHSCRSHHGSYPPMEKPQCGTIVPSSSLLSHGDQDQHKAYRLSPLSPRTSPKFTSLERDFWRGPYVFQHLAAETTGLQSLTVPTDTLMGLKQMWTDQWLLVFYRSYILFNGYIIYEADVSWPGMITSLLPTLVSCFNQMAI